MSEIWTPGGPPPSEPSGGIELPKGFATSRREKASEEKSEEQKPENQTEETASADPAAGQPGMDFLFPPAGVQVTCPNCQTPYTAPVFSIIDLGANPELRELILGGQINVAVCPSCNAGGALSAPLMVHDPENQFLGVVVPGQSRMDDMQAQKAIGEMSKALMTRLPNEQRRGYMLQPQQFFDWNSFLEKLWGFEGVTPEMLRRQRDQSELISSLVRLGDDASAMQMIIDRRKDLIDRDFFGMLGQVINAMAAQGQTQQQEALLNLRSKLLETTEAGKEVKALEGRVQEALEKLRPNMTREELLDLLLGYWLEGDTGETIATTVLATASSLADYEFLMALANRLDASDDPEERAALLAMRERILEMNEQRNQGQQAAVQEVQAVLQEVLQATDTEAALRENVDAIDEMFLAVLASNIEQAEQNNARFAVQRLRTVYEKALAIVEERMPPDLKLLNQLLSAPDEGTMRRLLQENRSLLSREFVDAMKSLEERFRSEGNEPLAGRIKSIRGQAALLL